MAAKPKAVFLGTPLFSVPALRALAGIAEVVLVVSRPDRRRGRGKKILPTPVKKAAAEISIPIIQPESLKEENIVSDLKAVGADFFFTVAYGEIIPPAVLEIPPRGCLNLHPSLLPRYRGSAPIQWAVINGEKKTGFTLMMMDAGMDSGPILERKEIDVLPGETAGDLAERMSGLMPEFIRQAVPRFLLGELRPEPQDESLATYAPMLKKQDGLIDWNRPAAEITARILGMNPWPAAHIFVGKRRIKILRAEVAEQVPEPLVAASAGRTLCKGGSITIKCGSGAVRVTEIQAEGKKAMDPATFLRGTTLPEKLDW